MRLVDRIGTGGGWCLTFLTAVAALGVAMAACVGPAIEVSRYWQVPVPDRRSVTITDPGEYTIFHEYDGARPNDPDAPALSDVAVTTTHGTPVELRAASVTKGQTFGGRDFVAIYRFDARKGRYVVSADGDPALLAIGKEGGLKWMFLLLLPAFALVVLAIHTGKATYDHSRRHRVG